MKLLFKNINKILPELQPQEKLPGELIHFWSHPPLFLAHSLISIQSNRVHPITSNRKQGAIT